MSDFDILFPIPSGNRNADDMGLPSPLKPPTRTLPKLVMRDWGDQWPPDKALSDFTRVVEEVGILDQERPQKEKSRDE